MRLCTWPTANCLLELLPTFGLQPAGLEQFNSAITRPLHSNSSDVSLSSFPQYADKRDSASWINVLMQLVHLAGLALI